MMSFVSGGLDSMEDFGIDLKLDSFEAEAFYCEALRLWFEKNKGYDTLSMTDREFTISDGFEDTAIVYISDSILRMKPIAEDPYEILVCLLEFIAENHKKTIEVYNYLEENEQEIMSWPQSDFYEKEDLPTEDDSPVPSEKDSEEDSDEWI
tara:strand:+ start:2184 stop:2636 length:453 start_codon:yes stop_codon:yes gene_type:complete